MLSRGRVAAGWLLALAGLPALTVGLTAMRTHVGLPSVLLLYLLTVVAAAVLGGVWPAIAAALVAFLLANWYFTLPLHSLSIAEGDKLVSLVVFVVVAGVVSWLVDTTARRTAEAAAAARLVEVDRLRTALLHAVSHDLRSPLAATKAAVSSLLQTDVQWTAAEVAELLATIDEETDRLDALVGNLLDMGRLEAGMLSVHAEEFDLHEVLPGALDAVPGAQLVVEITDAIPPVLADAGLLERVIANLAGNAVQWSPHGSPPRVHVRADAGRVEIRVIDTGPGVAPAARERMFEPFQRMGDRGGPHGVGLGLAVARGLTEAMGGTLTAEDTPGGGLTMVVTLSSSAAASARR